MYRILFIVGLAFAGTFANTFANMIAVIGTPLGELHAQTIVVDQSTLINRLNRLERRLQLTEQRLYSQPVGTTEAAGDAGAQLNSEYEIRLQELETESTQLYGSVEQLARAVEKIAKKIDQLMVDLDIRLQDLERDTLNAQQKAQIAVQSQSLKAPDPIEVSEEMTVPQGIGGEDLYKKAYGFLTAAKYAPAQMWLQTFLERFPEHTLADNATYWLGEVYLIQNNTERALVTFKNGLAKFPEGRKAPANLLKMGEALRKLNQHQHAKSAWEKLVQDHPGTTEASQAQILLRELEQALSAGT